MPDIILKHDYYRGTKIKPGRKPDKPTVDRLFFNKGLFFLSEHKFKEGDIRIYEGYFSNKPKDYPWGYYQTAFALFRKEAEVGQWFEFDALHDSSEMMDPVQKMQARVNTVLSAAEHYLESRYSDA